MAAASKFWKTRREMTTRNFSCIILLLALAATVAAHTEDCVYNLFVKTGDRAHAGTDAKINVTMANSARKTVKIQDLEKWGLMGSQYDYFESGNLDIFGARKSCIDTPICKIKIGSDGRGDSPGWYIEYVEVTVAQVHEPCSRSVFPIDDWLGVDDPPYELSVTLEECKRYVA